MNYSNLLGLLKQAFTITTKEKLKVIKRSVDYNGDVISSVVLVDSKNNDEIIFEVNKTKQVVNLRHNMVLILSFSYQGDLFMDFELLPPTDGVKSKIKQALALLKNKVAQ